METRHRFLGETRNNNRFGYGKSDSDSDFEFAEDLEGLNSKTVPKAIWELYEDVDEPLSEHDRKAARARAHHLSKRQHSPWFYTYWWLALVGIFILIAQIYTNKDVAKIKADMGIQETDDEKIHPDAWWKSARFYYINPRSFQDSNGDGIGDIKGIIQRLDHLSSLRIDAVILGSVLKSAGVDPGRDVSSFTIIDPVLGTMKDFEKLHALLHERGIYLLMETIPNHTSVKHPWFTKSREQDNKYMDYYIWHEGKTLSNGTRIPPNNWLSRYGGSMWTLDPERKQFYLHQFHPSMPDLNHHSQHVRVEIMKFLEYWLDMGVDGFIIEDIDALFEAEDYALDEPEADDNNGKIQGIYESLDHLYTDKQPEIHDHLATWREILDNFQMSRGRNKIFLGANTQEKHMMDVLMFYSTGIDAPYNYFLTRADKDCDARCMHELVDEWLILMPEQKFTLWVAGSAVHGRLSSIKGPMYSKALAVLQLTLPGSCLIYYGDEIGMTKTYVDFKNTKDLRARFEGSEHYKEYSRDPHRTPMQWNANQMAGFTTGTTSWLPINDNYKDINVEKQSKQRDSFLSMYRKLTELFEQPSFHNTNIKFSYTNSNIFSILRYQTNSSPHLVIMNFGKDSSTDDYIRAVGSGQALVKLYVTGHPDHVPDARLAAGQRINLAKVTLHPGDALIVELF